MPSLELCSKVVGFAGETFTREMSLPNVCPKAAQPTLQSYVCHCEPSRRDGVAIS